MKNYLQIILIVIFVAGFRSCVFEPFMIPSGSMIPTLMIGDFVVVDKTAYGYKIPYTEYQTTGSKYLKKLEGPKRGDIIVFTSKEGPSYIKRVIGIPGDEIVYENKKIFVNGKELSKTQVDYDLSSLDDSFNSYKLDSFKEIIDNKEYIITESPDRPEKKTRALVPDGEYFVMGDNRDFSHDSRYWGFVPFNKIKGKANFIWMSWQNPWLGHQAKEFDFRPERIGTDLR